MISNNKAPLTFGKKVMFSAKLLLRTKRFTRGMRAWFWIWPAVFLVLCVISIIVFGEWPGISFSIDVLKAWLSVGVISVFAGFRTVFSFMKSFGSDTVDANPDSKFEDFLVARLEDSQKSPWGRSQVNFPAEDGTIFLMVPMFIIVFFLLTLLIG